MNKYTANLSQLRSAHSHKHSVNNAVGLRVLVAKPHSPAQRVLALMLSVALLLPNSVWAGAYVLSGEQFGADLITHPPGYNGTGGQLDVNVCIVPGSPNAAQMEIPIQNTLRTWNRLRPTTGNLQTNGLTFSQVDFESIALHEVGHCIGLAHVNAATESGLVGNDREYTKATNGADDTFNLNAGIDGIIGSSDDVRGDDVNLHWFNSLVNNPFTINLSAPIDATTYSVDVADLPPGHLFAANAERQVGAALGFPNTQAVMQQGATAGETDRELIADGVATIRLAASGLDETEGTADDYTLNLIYGGISSDPSCDISISFDNAQTGFAVCSSSLSIGGGHAFVQSGSIFFNTNSNWFYNQVPNTLADLSVTKSDAADPVAAGAALAYTINVSNAGPDEADTVVVTETLPSDVTFVSTTGCNEDPSGVPTCTLGNIAANGSDSYIVNVTVNGGASGVITNSVTVSSQTTEDSAGDETATENTTITAVANPEADLSITKSDSVDPVLAGNNLTYTITVNNAGPDGAQSVVVTDNLPAGTTLVSTSGCAEDPNGAPTCSLGNINNGGSAQYTITVAVDEAQTANLSNTATVTSATDEANPGNESATETTTVNEQADISVTKTDSADPLLAGAAYSYTIEVTNSGPSTATDVVATDTLPSGVTFVSTSGCNEDPSGVPTCTLGSIATGTAGSYTVNVTADAATNGTVTNTVSVTSAVADNATGNNSTTENTQINPPTADLSITKSDDVDPIVAGNNLVYTVTVANAGPQLASNVVVTDTLPAGVTFVSTSGCNEDPAGVPTCTLGDIANGANDSFTIDVTVDAATTGNITNNASVTSDTNDNVAANDSTSEGTTVSAAPADLSITKSDSVDPVLAGSALAYTVTVSNAGPNAAADVVVTDTLPAGVTFVSTSGCNEDPSGVPTCTLGTIANAASDSYTVNVTIDSGTSGSISNAVSVASSTADNVAGNNSANETTQVNQPVADLSVTKADSVDPVIAGNALAYTITVNNAGPNTAAAVVVTDTLPAGVTFVSTSGCNEDPAGVPTCTLGDIANGDSDSYMVNVTVDSGTTGSISNSVSVASNTTDNTAGNNSASETTQVNPPPPDQADLTITKSDSVDPVTAGNNLTYTIAVSNAGPDAATDVVVTDNLPSGVTLVSTSGCNEDPNGVPTCTLGTINNGSSSQYTVLVSVDSSASGTLVNAASVSSSTGDPATGGESVNESTAVSAVSDLAITKSDSADPVTAGDSFSYTVSVANSGPSDASNVVVTDTLPSGISFNSTVGCAEDPLGVPTCTLGTIAASASDSYIINVTADAGTTGSVTNNASVTTSSSDNVSGNDSASESTQINAPTANLSITKSDSVDPVVAGNSLSYTINVANAGPNDATNVVVTDTLPVGVTFVSTSGCAEDPNGVPACTLGNIANAGSDSYTVNVNVDVATSGDISNAVTVASSTNDPANGNNSTTETTTVTAAPADLSITKSDSVDPVIAGQALAYTVTVNNAGPNTAADVVVTDTLPAGVTLVSTSGCNEDPNGVPTCTLGSIASSANDSYTINVTVDSATSGTITNSASVATSTTDNVSANNSTTENTTVNQPVADLAVTKSDSVDPVVAGNALSYIVGVANNGPQEAVNVVVTDTLPAGVTFVSTSGCNEDPNGVPACTLGNIANGANDSYTVNVTVDVGTSGSINNSVSVSSDTTDNTSGNDTATESTAVTAAPADLSITKSDSVDPVIAGGALVYTVTVNNAGPNTAADVVVTDSLPAGVTFGSTSGCNEDPNGLPSCTLGSIASGANDSYTINVTVDSGTSGTITNNASVASSTTDNVAGNNSTSESTTVNQPVADLAITKSDSVDPIVAGNALNYTIGVSNNGPQDAANVVVTDTLPAGVTFVSTSGCNEDPSGVPTCTLGSIANGSSDSYTVSVTVDTATTGNISNSVSVASSTTDNVAGNNTASESTTVDEAPADLSITKSDSTDPVLVGSALAYTVTVSNAGPNAAANVVVTDTLPSDVTFVSTSGCNEDPNGVPTCSLGSIAANGDDSYTINVTVNNDASGTLTNNASVVTSTTENVTGNNSTSETTAITQLSADLAITKSDSVDPVVAGNALAYTINVSNSGPNDASSAVVTDTLPAGVTFVSTSGCAEDPSGVPTCTLGTIANGSNASYTVNVTVDVETTGSINNQVSVSSAVGDPVAGNNSASESTSVTTAPADLVISKADSVDPVLAGAAFNYTVAVQNNGPNTAENVVVTDTLPAGLSFVSTSGCSEDPSGVPTCTLGNIANGVSESYTINVTADSGTNGLVTNSASVSASTPDNVSANNSTSEGTTVNQPVADLAVTKSDSVDPVVAGNALSYTVAVSNNGPQEAVNVVVTDTLPAGVTFVSTSGCNEDPNGVPMCTLGNIANGANDSYTVNVTVDTATTGSISNNVSVSANTTDNVAGNNSAIESTTVSEAPVDLSITKSDSVDPVLVGGALAYTVTVNNAGPNTAANVVVTDTLPSDVSFVSTSGCNEDPSGVPTCTLGSIAANGSDNYTINVTVNNDASGTLTNNASVATSTTENATGNNSTSETTAVSQLSADLAVTKSDSVDPVVAGSALAYTVMVSNSGPNDASNVVVTDTLPAGVTFVSTSGCAEDPSGVPTCTLGTIANGTNDSYTINVNVDTATSGSISNQVSVTSSVSDPASGNNSATESTSVTAAPADVSISKSDSVDPVLAGGALAYTVTASNAGPNTASNVVVNDTLPAGVTFVSTSGCDEDPNGVPTCTLGDIASGSNDAFTINVTVDSGTSGSITNNASVSTSTTDNVGGNNSTSESTTVNQPVADLAVTKSDSVDPVVAGNALAYTVNVSNNGPQAAANVVVTDTLPAGVSFVSTSGCNEDPNGVPSCSLGSIASGDSDSYVINVNVDTSTTGSISNNVSVASSTTDNVAGNNTASESTTVNEAPVDLSITKSDSVDPVLVGNALAYTVTVNNAGPNTAANVVVTDTLPSDVTFVSTSGCNEDPNGVPSCTLGSIAANGSDNYTINVTVNNDASGTLTNNASVTTSTTENATGNNSTSETTAVSQLSADLAVTKSDSADPVLAGNALAYTISVSNNGPNDASNVLVTDTLPAGVSFVSTSGCAEDPAGVPSCTLGTIANGSSDSYTVNVTVDSSTSGSISNQVSVASAVSDPVSANNNATESTTVNQPAADLAVTKSDSVDPVVAGNALSYTVGVSNNGPQDATNVVVTDTLPAGVTFVSTSGCNEDPNGVPTCSLGNIANGDSDSYTVNVTVDTATSGSISNSVSVSASTTDNVAGNNSASETTTVSEAPVDLSITKSDSVDPVLVGNALAYTITVNNAGPNTAANVVVTDTLPSDVTFVSTSGCNEDPNGVPSCTLGSIAASGSDSYTINVTVNNDASGTLTNNATVATSTTENATGNNSTTETTAVSQLSADLAVTKSDSVDPVVAGSALAYTVSVSNSGPNTATNVVVTDTLPAGVAFVSTSGCAEDPSGVPSCTLGNIANGSSASYTINVNVDTATSGVITNNASVSSSVGDSVSGNNSTSENTTVNEAPADLSITKSDSVDPVLAGNALAYTVTVNNAGPNTASNVVVTDSLPAGVTFVSTSGCAEDPAGVPTCSLGSIASGGNDSYTINVNVDSGTSGSIVNSASVASSTSDNVSGNNSTTESTQVNQPSANLSISKTDSVDPVAAGGNLRYTITVNNAGPNTAEGVVVTDTLPAGVTFVSTTGCAEDPNGLPSCTLGSISNGGAASYVIDVTVNGGTSGTFTNNASVTATTNDPVSGNNSVSQSTTVAAAAVCDIAISPAAANYNAVTAGFTESRSFTISNSGTGSCSVSSISVAGTDFALNAGSAMAPTVIAPSGSVTVTVDYTPAAAGSDTGTVSVSSNDPSDPTISAGLSGRGAIICDVDASGQVDRFDINQIFAARNQSSSGPADRRDANSNGIINVGDARRCARQCDKPRCRP